MQCNAALPRLIFFSNESALKASVIPVIGWLVIYIPRHISTQKTASHMADEWNLPRIAWTRKGKEGEVSRWLLELHVCSKLTSCLVLWSAYTITNTETINWGVERLTGGPWGTLAQVDAARTAWKVKRDDGARRAAAWRVAMRRVESMMKKVRACVYM